MSMETIDLLLEIAQKAGLYESSDFKTGIIAKKLNVSQQTISNGLKELENKGLIKREPFYLGITVSISEQGRFFLQSYRERIGLLFQKLNSLEGVVFSGLGEGSFYINQKEYKNQFKEKLGITPFPGTLNIKVDPLSAKRFLLEKKTIIIEGFKSKNRTFGALRAYPVKINNIFCAIIMPERTHYSSDTIELISEIQLRKKLKLKDGDKIKIIEA
jgi:riboflavin kinase, archaea type